MVTTMEPERFAATCTSEGEQLAGSDSRRKRGSILPFHLSSSLLGEGSIILPGNWGRLVRLIGVEHKEWLRENILEQIRANEFPDLPSRFDCIFYFEDLAEATFYQSSRPWPDFHLLYEVRLIEPNVPKHNADWKSTAPYVGDGEWARRYWRGDIMPDRGPRVFCRECLTLSPLQVLRRLT